MRVGERAAGATRQICIIIVTAQCCHPGPASRFSRANRSNGSKFTVRVAIPLARYAAVHGKGIFPTFLFPDSGPFNQKQPVFSDEDL
jgi:hypothetical protein